jgi:hypothetical protein
VVREVLARHDVSAPVRTECWSPREQKWLYADEMSADIAAGRRAEHEYRQEQERERLRRAGFPARQVRVEVPSHRDVITLAGHLAAQGWRVRPRRAGRWVSARYLRSLPGRVLNRRWRRDGCPPGSVRRIGVVQHIIRRLRKGPDPECRGAKVTRPPSLAV